MPAGIQEPSILTPFVSDKRPRHTEAGQLAVSLPSCTTGGQETRASWVRQQKQPVFSLPSSDNESKTNIVKVIRSILRENFRRHIKCELPLEKTCKDRLVPLKNRVPVSAKLGENLSSLGYTQENMMNFSASMYALRTGQPVITL